MTCFRFKTDQNQISSHDIGTQVRQASDKNKCNDQLHLSVVLMMLMVLIVRAEGFTFRVDFEISDFQILFFRVYRL